MFLGESKTVVIILLFISARGALAAHGSKPAHPIDIGTGFRQALTHVLVAEAKLVHLRAGRHGLANGQLAVLDSRAKFVGPLLRLQGRRLQTEGCRKRPVKKTKQRSFK